MCFKQKVLTCILVACVSFLGAETVIILKNGTVFKGAITSDAGNFITLNSNGAPVRVLKSIVATIDGAPYQAGTPLVSKKPELAGAVEITLTNGTVYRGTVIEADDDMIVLNVDGANVRIPRAGVASKKAAGATPAPVAAAETTADPAALKTSPVTTTVVPENGATQPAGPKPIEPGTDHSVMLKNGTSFTGTLVSENANFFCFKINTSKVNILKTMIAEFDGAPFGKSAAVPTPPPPSAPAPASPPAVMVQPSTPAATVSAQPPAALVQPSTPAAAVQPPTPAATGPAPSIPAAKAETQKPVSPPLPPIAAQPAPAKPAVPIAVTAPAAKSSVPVTTQAPADSVKKNVSAALAPAVATAAVLQSFASGTPDPEMSETYRRMIFALQAARQGANAAPSVPRLIELLADETPFKPTPKEKKKFRADTLEGKTPARAARYALAMLDTTAVLPLLEAMNIRTPAIRANAAWALGEIKDARTVDALLNGVKDSSAMVRARSSEALGKVRDPRSIPALVTMLGADTSEIVRNATQISLNNLTDIPTLIEGLHDPHKLVRDNVAYILFLMTAQDFRNDPQKWESWWKEQHMLPDSTAEPADDKKGKKEKKKR